MASTDAERIGENVAAVRERIRRAGGTGISLVAVTKTLGAAEMRAALGAGCDAVGENYVQELLAKIGNEPPPGPVHMIGSLQTNKVRKIDRTVALWQTVDRPALATEIGRRVPGGGCAEVLLQVNLTGEASKAGCRPEDLDGLRDHAGSQGLVVRGLMTIGPTHGTPAETEAAFRRLRSLCDSHLLEVCSMGMSGDFEVAAACGSTMVRIGTAIFGPRPAAGDVRHRADGVH